MFLDELIDNDPMRRSLCSHDPDAAIDFALAAAEEAEKKGTCGNVLHASLGVRLASSRCAFARACEMTKSVDGSIVRIAERSLWEVRNLFLKTEQAIRLHDHALYKELSDFKPSAPSTDDRTSEAQDTASKICGASSPHDAVSALMSLYGRCGSGEFFEANAFRWDSNSGLVPVRSTDVTTLDSLSGYERQKELLRANVAHFLSGGSANNVLLHGDSGTGKSTSVRALLNEPGYTDRGLRMIELFKDQFRDIPKVLDAIRGRRYRFIIFMDDLSFEEFEVEYKYLKALIEGGVEPRPENVIVCATSNRRNLIREVWADRRESDEDVHGRDTMQEKLSLADRFGLSLWYGPSDKDGYISMIRSIAASRGAVLPTEGLEQMALKWEIERGGFTGRTAKQFVDNFCVGDIDLNKK